MSREKSTIDRFSLVPGELTDSLADQTTAPVPPPAPASAEPAALDPGDGRGTRGAADGDEAPARVPGVARGLATVLERAHPAIAARLAERLWFHLPPAPDRARRERRTPAGGEAFEVPWERGAIRGRAYGHWGNPTAYLVHGWGGWWQQLGAHVEPLLEAGLCVVAMDLPGHGDSGPGRHGRRSTDVIEMAQAYAAVVAEFGRPTLTVAHSIGAMAAMHALAEGVRPEALAFLAPPVAAEPMVRRFGAGLGLDARTTDLLRERISRRAGVDVRDLDLELIAAQQPSLPSLLVVHDRADRETSASGSVALTTAWHDARLLLTDGLGHRRLLWEPAVVERVTDLAVQAAAEVRRSAR